MSSTPLKAALDCRECTERGRHVVLGFATFCPFPPLLPASTISARRGRHLPGIPARRSFAGSLCRPSAPRRSAPNLFFLFSFQRRRLCPSCRRWSVSSLAFLRCPLAFGNPSSDRATICTARLPFLPLGSIMSVVEGVRVSWPQTDTIVKAYQSCRGEYIGK